MAYRSAEIVIFAFGYPILEPIRHSLRHAETFVFDRSPPLSNSWQNNVWENEEIPLEIKSVFLQSFDSIP
jgi:hypothetical protein